MAASACSGLTGAGPREQHLTLAAGPPESVAGCVARAFTTRLNEEHGGIPATVLRTRGAVDSLVAVRDRRAELAIATADTLAQAVNGEGPFEGQTLPARTLATLYPSDVSLVVPAGSAINGLSQVRDVTAGIGPAGSGMDLTVRRLLSAARLESRVRTESRSWDEIAARFQQRELPAFFWVDGSPSPALERLAAAGVRLRALNTASVVPLLQQRHGEILYTAVEVRPGPGFDSDLVGLAAVWTVLVSRPDLSEATAFTVTSALFRLTPDLTRTCAALSGLRPSTGARPQAAALHAGAALFYRQGGTDRGR